MVRSRAWIDGGAVGVSVGCGVEVSGCELVLEGCCASDCEVGLDGCADGGAVGVKRVVVFEIALY